jgi:hypothetical protein
MYEMLTDRENEPVRDRFFRVLWIATLIWKLAGYPLEEQEAQLDILLHEARFTNPDGTPKLPKIKKSKKPDDKNQDEGNPPENPPENPTENPTETSESFERIKIKMKFNKKKKK